MKKVNKIIYKVLFLFIIVISAKVEGKILSEGSSEAKVTIKVFRL